MRRILILSLLNLFMQQFDCVSKDEIANVILPINDVEETDQRKMENNTSDVGELQRIVKRGVNIPTLSGDKLKSAKLTFGDVEGTFKEYLENVEYDANVNDDVENISAEDGVKPIVPSFSNVNPNVDNALSQKLILNKIYQIIKYHNSNVGSNEGNLEKGIAKILRQNNVPLDMLKTGDAVRIKSKKCKRTVDKGSSINDHHNCTKGLNTNERTELSNKIIKTEDFPQELENKQKFENKIKDSENSIKFKRNNERFVKIRKQDDDFLKQHKREKRDDDKKTNFYIIQKQKKRQDEFHEGKDIRKHQKRQKLQNKRNGQTINIKEQQYKENVEKLKAYLMKDTIESDTIIPEERIRPNNRNRANHIESNNFYPTESKIKVNNKIWNKAQDELKKTFDTAQEQIQKNIKKRHRLCGHARKVPISNPDNCPQLTCGNKNVVRHAWIDCMFGRGSRVRVLTDSNTSDVDESDGDRLADIDSADESTMSLAHRMTRYQCVCDVGYLIHGGDCIRPNECIIHLGKDPVVIKNYERQLGLD